MSKLTVIARFYTIILTGYHQTKRKTEKTESNETRFNCRGASGVRWNSKNLDHNSSVARFFLFF